ncbi:MAG: hypothetical protein Q9M31_08625, partial [Mariprofundus sp.]|nr:hypothetical protein [Mariprofundus sp.]
MEQTTARKWAKVGPPIAAHEFCNWLLRIQHEAAALFFKPVTTKREVKTNIILFYLRNSVPSALKCF